MADVRLTATNPEDSSVVPVACNAKGELKLEEFPDQSFDGNLQGDLTVSGRATFGGSVLTQDGGVFVTRSITADDESLFFANDANGGGKFSVTRQGTYIGDTITNAHQNANTALFNNGAVTFAGNRAGFTREGYLWCTTERGDTIRLVGSSNGMAVWENYTPSTRLDEIKEQWSEKNGIRPMPEESSQDEPETKQ